MGSGSISRQDPRRITEIEPDPIAASHRRFCSWLAAIALCAIDDKSHWVTDCENSRIVVAPGSFRSEFGCAGDCDPGCLLSWLENVDGDGVYEFFTTGLPAGTYEAKH
jgi:hypothetical protein